MRFQTSLEVRSSVWPSSWAHLNEHTRTWSHAIAVGLLHRGPKQWRTFTGEQWTPFLVAQSAYGEREVNLCRAGAGSCTVQIHYASKLIREVHSGSILHPVGYDSNHRWIVQMPGSKGSILQYSSHEQSYLTWILLRVWGFRPNRKVSRYAGGWDFWTIKTNSAK